MLATYFEYRADVSAAHFYGHLLYNRQQPLYFTSSFFPKITLPNMWEVCIFNIFETISQINTISEATLTLKTTMAPCGRPYKSVNKIQDGGRLVKKFKLA